MQLLRRGSVATGATWHLIVLAHLEIFLVVALVAIVSVLIPPNIDFELFSWLVGADSESEVLAGFVMNLLGYSAAVLLAPFFVGGGFGLYINRRIILEGWDLEIEFRRLAKRMAENDRSAPTQPRERRRASSALALILGMALLIAAAQGPTAAAADAGDRAESIAQTPAQTTALTPQSARSVIEEVLERDVFHKKQTVLVPQLIEALRSGPDDDESWLVRLLRTFLEWLSGNRNESKNVDLQLAWLKNLIEWLAVVVEVLLIAAAIGVVVFIVHRYRGVFAAAGPDSRGQRSRPRVLLGLEISPESLPGDVVASVRALSAAKKFREAVALLYRASLVGLMERHGTKLHASMTERDCVRAAKVSAQQTCASYFVDLTRDWQLAAYAHRPPSAQSIEALCEDWPRFFGAEDVATPVDDAEDRSGGADG